MPQIGRVEISIIEEQQAAWLAFQNNELDILYLREQFAPVALPNNQVNADLARRGVTLEPHDRPRHQLHVHQHDRSRNSAASPRTRSRCAARSSCRSTMPSTSASSARARRSTRPYPIPPGVIGNDPTYRSIVPYDPQLANKLLDYFGYKRGADGYRTWPNGKPLVWRYSSTPSSRDRELDELWQKSVERIGVRLQVDKNRFPEELKRERACQLLSRTASWIADYPDGDDFMQLFYGPNSHQNNNACFQLAEWDRIYLKTKTMPDSPERNRLYRQLWRMVEVNGVMKMHDTRYRNMLLQPQVVGYKKHPILLAEFIYFDIDNSRRR